MSNCAICQARRVGYRYKRLSTTEILEREKIGILHLPLGENCQAVYLRNAHQRFIILNDSLDHCQEVISIWHELFHHFDCEEREKKLEANASAFAALLSVASAFDPALVEQFTKIFVE